MNLKRALLLIRSICFTSGRKRAEYFRKKHIFAEIGDNVCFTPLKPPLYPELIRIHDNVIVASNVLFVTHDAFHTIVNRQAKEPILQEGVGCIEIGNNVFIGSNVTILYGVKIGNNVLVAAGTVVNHDVPDNSIVAGVPARVIGTYDKLVEKRMQNKYPKELAPKKQAVSEEMKKYFWNEFDLKHNSGTSTDL